MKCCYSWFMSDQIKWSISESTFYVNQPLCLDSILYRTDLPVWLVQLRSACSPDGPGLPWGCRTRPPACLCGRPAELSRPPPSADGLTGSGAGVPAHDGPSPAGHSDAQTSGSSVPDGQQTERSANKCMTHQQTHCCSQNHLHTYRSKKTCSSCPFIASL